VKRTTCTQWWQFCTEGVHSRGGNTQQCDSALSACLSTGVWDTCSGRCGGARPWVGRTETGLIRK
jgi:hypothetical protein